MRIALALTASLALFAMAAQTQSPPNRTLLINRMSLAYQSPRSFQDVATIKRKIGKKEAQATLTLAMQKPNRYLLDLKGEHLNTTIVSDGNSLIALRPDRKAYTKVRAPRQIARSDFIGTVDMPSLGARLITQLLTGNVREGEIGQLLMSAHLAGPQDFHGRQAYVFTFPYADEFEAQVYVTTDDHLVRQVKLTKGGEVVWLENHDDIQLNREVPANTFHRPLPEGARMVTALPPLDRPTETASADSKDASDSQEEKSDERASLLALGRSVYNSNGCSRCHSIGGQGGRLGPDLSHIGAEAGHTPERLAAFIKNPRAFNPSSLMPAFEGRINARNLRALSEWLVSLK